MTPNHIRFDDGTYVFYIPQETDPKEIKRSDISLLHWHREDGPACVFYTDRRRRGLRWMTNNVYHRYDGSSFYFEIMSEGKWVKEPSPSHDDEVWDIHGTTVDTNEYLNWIDVMGMDINNLSDNDKILIDMKWVNHDDKINHI